MARHNLLSVEEAMNIEPRLVAPAVAEAARVKEAAPMWSLNLASGSGVVKGRILDVKVAGFRETRCYRSVLFEVTINCDNRDSTLPNAPAFYARKFKVRRLPNV